MKKTLCSTLVLCSLSLASACAEEEKRNSAPADANQVVLAQTAADDLDMASSASTDAASAGGAQSTLTNLYGSYNQMAQYTLSTTQGFTPAPVDLGIVVPYAETINCVSGSYTWDTTGVTYDHCDGLNGSLTWNGDTYTFDITYDFGAIAGGAYDGTMTYNGELTISDTMIDGHLDLSYDFTMNSEGVSYTYASDMSIDYDEVTLESGCPAGGSLDMAGDFSYDYAGQSYDGGFHITYQFNACNDITVLY